MDHVGIEPRESIGVMSVATNIYLDYWKSMVRSADGLTNIIDEVTFFVFTDKPEEAEKFALELKHVRVRAFKIPQYGWPEATLLRYQIFDSYSTSLDSKILMHLDADMLFASNPWSRVRAQLSRNSICLVEHPGFWRPTGVSRLILYVSRPVLAYKDLRLRIKRGGLGAWECDAKSSAFVSRESRMKYYCGGTWFGKRDSIIKLISELSIKVNDDIKKNIIAIWHDESHINRWATENHHSNENPELCFDQTYPQIKRLTPAIIAVRKSEKTR